MKFIGTEIENQWIRRQTKSDANRWTSRLMIVIVSISIAILLFIGYRDIVHLYNGYLDEIHGRMNEVTDDIDQRNQLILVHLETLNTAYQNHSFTSTALPANMAPIYDASSDQFHFDVAVAGTASSFSGYGRPGEFSPEMIHQIQQNQVLIPFFKITKENIDGIQWIYFVSKHGFVNIYPSIPPQDYLYSDETAAEDFFLKTLPENNPTKQVIATGVYNDLAGAGLMVTLSKPIYDNGEFQGSLSIDVTLKQLTQVLQNFDLKGTDFFLINDRDEIMARNDADEEPVEIQKFKTVLDEKGINGRYFKQKQDETASKRLDGYLVEIHNLEDLPWRLITLTKVQTIYGKIIKKQILLLLLIVSLLVFTVLFKNRLKNRLAIYNSQLKFEQVVDQTVQLMAVLDTQGKILFVNQTALAITQGKKSDYIGKYFYDTPWWNWSSELIEFIQISVKKVLKGESVKRDVIHYDFRGNLIHVEFVMNPIYNEKGVIEYLVANGKDITDRIKLKESMDKLIKMDILTKLGNRRAILDNLEHEISRYNRTKSVFSLLMCDIDYFKHVNDTYGHNVGDEVLREIAQFLLHTVRDYDEVGRWGGEEFIIILPETDYDDALELAHRLCVGLEKMIFPDLDQPELNHVTLTIGVTSYSPDLEVQELIKQADDAMYYGKKHGRNQAVGYKGIGE